LRFFIKPGKSSNRGNANVGSPVFSHGAGKRQRKKGIGFLPIFSFFCPSAGCRGGNLFRARLKKGRFPD